MPLRQRDTSGHSLQGEEPILDTGSASFTDTYQCLSYWTGAISLRQIELGVPPIVERLRRVGAISGNKKIPV